ncbi:MAG: diphosphate--fructose-6-phosphate 1-phosphotransferase [Puniceicoccales bacterium]|jgi:6-phosphofructokinase 1|nr:diphosphate--fructose-6-phosphate 1-phosphotransferase [Puniceicoccales bacterium]
MMSDLLAGNVLAVQLECLSPVSNAILGGIISEALNYESIEEIYGSINGFRGILNHNLIDLALQPQQTIRDLMFTPGAVLGVSESIGRSPEEMEAIFAAFEEYNIHFLFVIGGLQAQVITLELSKVAQKRNYKIQIISIPDTIYNNLPITDHCLGYGSAVKFIAATLKELSCYMAAVANHDLVNIVEIKSGKSDWLVASALLDGNTSNIILLPSDTFSEGNFLKSVQNMLKANTYCNVIAGDFLINEDGNYVTGQGMDTATKLREILEESLEVRVLATKLGALPYTSAHFLSKTDIDEAYVCGIKAVSFALDDITGKMVTILRSESTRYGVEYGMADLANICGHEKGIPEHWFNEDGKLNNNFAKYSLPLIQGNMTPTEIDGLPKFAVLKK